VRVLGQGNLARLVPPPPPEVPGWRVYAGAPDPAPPQLVQVRGFIIFNFTLIPLTETATSTPLIPYSYFDPDTEKFVDLTLPALPVTVLPPVVPINRPDLAEGNSRSPDRETEPTLSDLATTTGRTITALKPLAKHNWFAAAQLVPALLLACLWGWDRQRRFHEAHPEVRCRRRARRALHQEWAALRKAVSLGDTSRFATCAVGAMRVAVAPHYPAEPRALVGSDVLPLLPGAENELHDAVRAVFAAANAERFSVEAPAATDLLVLRDEVDRVLGLLEEKLR